MALARGIRLGPYQIDSAIGAGAMGEVYKATDTRLERTVAIKVLPPTLTSDAAAKARFIQEAKAASGLDHVNICTIYDIGETDDGQLYLVMARYDGETLKQKIDGNPLSLLSAIDAALQVARGLAEAHRAAILHRDIKPANLMVTSAGVVKILDFGLAKLAGAEALTQAGTTLGTVAYMSPEQIKGEELDHRTDLWSLGVVLYEMVAGQRPFKGEQPQSVAVAVLRNQPTALSAQRTGVPPELEQVVRRALATRRDDRYANATDLASDLLSLKQTLERGSTATSILDPPTAAPAPTKPSIAAVVVGLVAVVALIVSFLRPSPPTTSRSSMPRFSNPVQVTSASGVEQDVAWSPDGRMLAFESAQAGNQGNPDIWITQVRSSQPVNRTADYDGEDHDPSWSPDGTEIAFASTRDGGGIFLMSAIGGRARKLVWADGDLTRYPRWSTDGSELAFLRESFDGNVRTDAVEIVSLTGEVRERVALPPGNGLVADLRWSPDRRLFAYIRTVDRNLADVTRLWLLPVGEDQAITLSAGNTKVASPQWAPDGRSLYFVSNRGGSMDLWQQRLATDGSADGAPEPVTTGLQLHDASLSPLGDRVAYSRGRNVANLWRLPILRDRSATWVDAEQVTFDEAYIEQFDLSPDDTQMVFSSDRSGNPDLWIMSLQTGDLRQLTTDPTPDWAPVWSPDGQTIAFYSSRSGNRDVWTMTAGGGPATQLTHSEAIDFYPAWSPNGQRIAFESYRGGRANVWVVSAASGTEPEQVTDAGGHGPRFSPDGERLAFRSSRDGRIWARPLTGGEAEPLSETSTGFFRWSPDGRQVYFWQIHDPVMNVGVVSLADRVEHQVTDLRGRPGRVAPGLAIGTEFLYIAWGEDTGDIWVMDVVQNDDDGSDD